MANMLLLTGVSEQFSSICRNMAAPVLDSELSPFAKVHGMPLYEWQSRFPREVRLFQDAMSDLSNHAVPLLLAKYDGFNKMKVLVDVGGGNGTVVAKIVERYPHIKGINFDLPQVVAQAPPCPGVEHVPGDMFESIPSGCDAIFMKSIIQNWSDEQSVKLLQNCHRVLPSCGKVVIVDVVVPDSPHGLEHSPESLTSFQFDMLMLVYTSGRERDAHQWQVLASKSGFGQLRFIRLNHLYVVEATKP